MADDVIVDMLRDQHREVLGRISVLDGRLETTRLEIKSDLVSERATVAANLAKQNDTNDAKFEALDKEINELKNWRAKAVGIVAVFMFVLTFAAQAIANGHFPGVN